MWKARDLNKWCKVTRVKDNEYKPFISDKVIEDINKLMNSDGIGI